MSLFKNASRSHTRGLRSAECYSSFQGYARFQRLYIALERGYVHLLVGEAIIDEKQLRLSEWPITGSLTLNDFAGRTSRSAYLADHLHVITGSWSDLVTRRQFTTFLGYAWLSGPWIQPTQLSDQLSVAYHCRKIQESNSADPSNMSGVAEPAVCMAL